MTHKFCCEWDACNYKRMFGIVTIRKLHKSDQDQLNQSYINFIN